MYTYQFIESHDSVYFASEVANQTVELVFVQMPLSAHRYPLAAPEHLKYWSLPPEDTSLSDL